MTVTMTNGDQRAAAIADAKAGMSRPELMEKYGMSNGWAGGVITESGRPGTRGRLAANGGSSASGVSPPPKPTPRAIDRKPVATVSRRRQQRDPIKIAATAVVLAVGLAVSYSHIVHLAVLAGAGWWAWVMPLPLDAMALVSLLHLATERRYLIAWAGVLVGAVGSLAANVLAVDPALADMRYVLWGFAALPPIAVIVCGHLLDRGARR